MNKAAVNTVYGDPVIVGERKSFLSPESRATSVVALERLRNSAAILDAPHAAGECGGGGGGFAAMPVGVVEITPSSNALHPVWRDTTAAGRVRLRNPVAQRESVTTSGMCALADHSVNSSGVLDPQAEEERSLGPSGPHIRCPLCGWSPRKDDLWSCTCGHDWNTFDTGGVCPACLHQWTSTCCPACRRWSPHSEWYAD